MNTYKKHTIGAAKPCLGGNMKRCFECETTEDLQEHHVVPRSKGGTKTVTLCYECHMKAHGRDGKSANHRRLTVEGLERAKARGVKLGNPRWKESVEAREAGIQRHANEQALRLKNIIIPLYEKLGSYRAVARALNEQEIRTNRGKEFSGKTVQDIIKRIQKLKEEE